MKLRRTCKGDSAGPCCMADEKRGSFARFDTSCAVVAANLDMVPRFGIMHITQSRSPHLHRHTIADRLGAIRRCFERLLEWGCDDALPRVPIFAADFRSRMSPCHDLSMTRRWPSCW